LWINFINDLATIIQIQKKVSALKKRKTLELILFEEVKRFSGLLIDIQQERLSKGQDTEGKILGRYTIATEGYALFGDPKPIQPKKAGQPYNLEWTGEFFESMFLQVFQTKATFRSRGKGWLSLNKQFDDLMGLDEDGKESALSEFLFNAFVKRVRRRMELKWT